MSDFSQFAWAKAVRDSDLPPNAKLIVFVVRTYMNRDGGGAFPSLPTIARGASLSRATVTRYLSDHIVGVWLKAEKRSGRPTIYAARYPDPISSSETGTPVSSSETGQDGRPSHPETAPVSSSETEVVSQLETRTEVEQRKATSRRSTRDLAHARDADAADVGDRSVGADGVAAEQDEGNPRTDEDAGRGAGGDPDGDGKQPRRRVDETTKAWMRKHGMGAFVDQLEADAPEPESES